MSRLAGDSPPKSPAKCFGIQYATLQPESETRIVRWVGKPIPRHYRQSPL